MNEHMVARRRIAALEQAVALIEREWSETIGGGPISVYTDRCSVEVSKFDEDAGGECWLTTSDLVKALREVLDDVTAIGRTAEQFALDHGTVEWRSADLGGAA